MNYENVNEIPEMSDSDIAFGAAFINGHMPKNPPKVDAKWHKLFSQVFYTGGLIDYDMKDGLTPEQGNKYYRFITSLMKSYGPKHQDKENACAYLYSVWLDDWEIVDVG